MPVTVDYRRKPSSCEDASSYLGKLLSERGARHGDFTEHARVAQALKAAANSGPSFVTLNAIQREAVSMILHKVARIVSGDPNWRDHWDDIAGYATLAADRIDTAPERGHV